MIQQNRKKTIGLLVVWIFAVMAATVCRQLARLSDGTIENLLNAARAGIYLILYAVWGFLLRRHVVERAVKNWLSAIVCLMLFWIGVRSIKFEIAQGILLSRYLWYSYYFPMLFIPLFSVFIALHMGKSEEYHMSYISLIPTAITIGLFVLVMTNDLHQAVFVFEGTVWSDLNYHYSYGYYLIAAWIGFCALFALGLMMHRSKVPHSKKRRMLPFLPVMLIVLYCVLYVMHLPVIRLLAGDLTAVMCQLTMITFVCCIQCGLIPANTCYDIFFEHSTLHAQIRRNDGSVAVACANSIALTDQLFEEVTQKKTVIKGNFRIRTAPIRGGWIVWQEDISNVNELLETLKENMEQLEGGNALLEAENEIAQRTARVEAQNQIYDRILIKQSKLLEQLEDCLLMISPQEKSFRKKMIFLSVLGSYSKRRTNLLLVSEKNNEINSTEIGFGIQESVENLSQAGINSAFSNRGQCLVTIETALAVYDSFEYVVEWMIDRMESFYVYFSATRPTLELRMMVLCQNEIEKDKQHTKMLESQLFTFSSNCRVQKEENEWVIVLKF